MSAELHFPLPAGPNGGPSPVLEELRSADRLARITLPSGAEVLVATDWADIQQIHGGAGWSRDLKDGPQFAAGDPYDVDALVNMDNPRHGVLRQMVAPLFSRERAHEQRPLIQAAATDLLDRIVESSPDRHTDLVQSFALPLPVAVICAILGLDTADVPRLRRWSDAFMSTSAVTAAQRTQAKRDFKKYIEDLIVQRHATPTSDVISELIAKADKSPEAMTHDVLVRMISSLIVAGHETTAVMISRAALTLMTHHEQVDRAGTDPQQWAGIVEEVLRYDTPGAGALLRRSTRNQELPSGRKVAAGEVVMAPIVAANNDPAIFHNPRQFDPQRSDKSRHLAFGHGPHHCLGAALARAELQVALMELFARLPRLRLAVPTSHLRWLSETRMVALQALPVAWG